MAALKIKKWYDKEMDVYYQNTYSDGYGGFKKEWQQKYTALPCRLYGETGNFTIQIQGVNYSVEERLICDADIEINKGDKVVVDDRQYIVLSATAKGRHSDSHTSCRLAQIEESA